MQQTLRIPGAPELEMKAQRKLGLSRRGMSGVWGMERFGGTTLEPACSSCALTVHRALAIHRPLVVFRISYLPNQRRQNYTYTAGMCGLICGEEPYLRR